MDLTFNLCMLLCLLELSTCAVRVPSHWSRGRISMAGALLQEKKTRNMFKCENWCRVTGQCISVSYSISTRMCSLFGDIKAKDIVSSMTDITTTVEQQKITGKCKPMFCKKGNVCVANGNDNLCLLAGISCGFPPEISDADASVDKLTYSSTVTYHCRPGYNFTGSSQIARCTEDGSWKEFNGECSLISCGSPPNIDAADPSGDVLTYNSTVTYHCRQGYNFTGSSRFARCTEDGSWKEFNGECSPISCGSPPEESNADPSGDVLTYNSTVTYHCRHGYNFVGSSQTARCTEDGSWKEFNGECSLISCETPPTVNHADVTFPATTFGSSATYKCNDGFAFQGDNSSIMCTESGWSQLDGSCEPVILTYIGCFQDNSERMLNDDYTSSTNMTVETCGDYCRERGYTFGGLQFVIECFCGSDYDEDQYPRKPEAECNSACGGNKDQKCGGGWRNSVYRVN